MTEGKERLTFDKINKIGHDILLDFCKNNIRSQDALKIIQLLATYIIVNHSIKGKTKKVAEDFYKRLLALIELQEKN